MAETYFDTTEGADTNLLRADVRTDSALERVADQAEKDCIEWYVKKFTTTVPDVPSGAVKVETLSDADAYVLLDGYAEDAADADGYDSSSRDSWTGFADAFRRAIATVIEHRLRYKDDDPHVTSVTRGKRSETREGGLNPDFPGYWNKNLKRYDLRQKTVVI